MRKKAKKNYATPFPPPEINVTPLIDVLLVLLIIFMLVNPSSAKKIDASLPQVQADTASSSHDDQVVVSLEASGKIKINNDAVDTKNYVQELRSRLIKLGSKIVVVQSADGATYKDLVKALDGAHMAGATSLAISTVPMME